jgi:hypothetical protein
LLRDLAPVTDFPVFADKEAKMVVALAGRRVDAPKAKAKRFPAVNLICVRERIRAALISRRARVLVCSAACGSDLLALDVAGDLGIRRRIVLPFPRDRFRTTSVTDRPGDWGPLFDRILDEVEKSGDVVVLDDAGDSDQAYSAASHAILEEAASMARQSESHAEALAVWNGSARGEDDLTATFMREAGQRGLPVAELSTL